MAILEEKADLTIVKCDYCGLHFEADECRSGRWEFGGDTVGYRDHEDSYPLDMCLNCDPEADEEE